ncbi:hypothetical protein ACFO25_11690 [Paenactinomyces guangxiensis]|uniref:hypothetical protein n=1 Tax=Paenactinomyces guangxiensis TaxID=1490290 RepID=UPI001E45988E|nr:hypothetical protein [Paenactinomyces guangxiensis]
MELKDLKHAVSYIHSEINRMETMAGTLSSIERDHYNKLTRFDHSELMDVAVEEQNAAKQLGAMKQMCLSISQKLEGIQQAIERGEFGGAENRDQTH